MATSYGSITIVDITDVGEFSVYPKANAPRTQIYNPDAAQHFIPNWDTSVSGGKAVVITPTAYYASTNVSSSATYVWKRRDGNGAEAELTTGETVGANGALTISQNVLDKSTSGIVSYIVYANYTVDGLTLNAVGEIDFSLTRQGSAAKTAKITGENIFKYDGEGNLIPTGKTITLTGTASNVNITGWSYKKEGSWIAYPGDTIDAPYTDTLVVSPSDDIFVDDSATIKLETADSTVYDLITITKLRDGSKGDEVVSAILSNESQMLPANAQGQITSYSGAISELTIYEGGQDVTNTWTITKELSNVTDSSTVSNKAIIDSLTADVGSVTFRGTKTDYDPISKKFSIVKVRTGADGKTPKIYSLEPNTVVANKSIDGSFTPNSVTFNAYVQEGNSKTAYTGRIQFYLDDQTSPYYAAGEQNVDRSTRILDLTATALASVEKVRAVLYTAGGEITTLDTQTLVITSDGRPGERGANGQQGLGAVNVIMGNEADVISCSPTNHPISQFIIDIPYEGYQGITRKATSVSAPVLPSADFGSNITPDTTEAGHVKYVIPTTATLSTGGQIELTFTVTADAYDAEGNIITTTVSIPKMYTWTRSSAATNGQNAVVLQITAEEGTIFENNSGTLTAIGRLYDGATTATGVTYSWAQYKTNEYVPIGTGTPGVTADGQTITINASAVEGYASFRLIATYKNNSYTQYISFIDKTDPLQVSIHSTVGTQIKNSQGRGCIYARVTRAGIEIDPVPMDVRSGNSYPSDPNEGDRFILLSDNESPSARTARLYKYENGDWKRVLSTCQYEWSFRDSNNIPITSGVPSQSTDKTLNQFIYIDASLINSKITLDCKVTLKD